MAAKRNDRGQGSGKTPRAVLAKKRRKPLTTRKPSRRLPRGRAEAQTNGPETDGPQMDRPAAELSEDGPAKERRFPIVGVGSSAGGLEALQELFSHMPPDSGMAFVVITHRMPGHVSMLSSLLSKSAKVIDGHRCRGRHAAVWNPTAFTSAPPESLTMRNRTLHRLPAEPGRSPHLPIDCFFRSLAADQRERAICIILSGTGADGTLGLRAMKAELGMAMVQEPPSAEIWWHALQRHRDADWPITSSPAAAMPQQLVTYIRGPYLRPTARLPRKRRSPTSRMQRILRFCVPAPDTTSSLTRRAPFAAASSGG